MKKKISIRNKSVYGGKIAIISDAHNNLVNLKKTIDYCARENIQTIICCGDLASTETLEYLSDNFSGVIHYVFGNMDSGQSRIHEAPRNRENVKIYLDFGEIEVGGRRVGFVHFPDAAKKLCETGKYKIVFYGHTHKPWSEKIGNCALLNPGNVAGEIYPPTFAVWDVDADEFNLIRVRDLK